MLPDTVMSDGANLAHFKLQHWRGFSRFFALKGAPVLVFYFRKSASA
jgi:hypothetical protein